MVHGAMVLGVWCTNDGPTVLVHEELVTQEHRGHLLLTSNYYNCQTKEEARDLKLINWELGGCPKWKWLL